MSKITTTLYVLTTLLFAGCSNEEYVPPKITPPTITISKSYILTKIKNPGYAMICEMSSDDPVVHYTKIPMSDTTYWEGKRIPDETKVSGKFCIWDYKTKTFFDAVPKDTLTFIENYCSNTLQNKDIIVGKKD